MNNNSLIYSSIRPRIHVIGDRPPPVTGENLCRSYLVATLRGLGYRVADHRRWDLRNIFIVEGVIWLLPGAKRLGHVRDVVLLALWLCLGRRVYIYIHNASWRYFLRLAGLWGLARDRLRFVVLTDNIAVRLRQRGLLVERLNNTLCEGAEPTCPPRHAIRRLLWISAVTIEKGFETAYSAFEILHAEDKDWLLDVYGDGPLALRKEEYPLANFRGFVNGASKQAAFDAGGVLVLPSAYVNETQPLAVIEALANGIPFVASDVGGLPQMRGAPDDIAGICMAPTVPPPEWALAIKRIATNYEAYSRAALKTYAGTFSRASYLSRLRQLLINSS